MNIPGFKISSEFSEGQFGLIIKISTDMRALGSWMSTGIGEIASVGGISAFSFEQLGDRRPL